MSCILSVIIFQTIPGGILNGPTELLNVRCAAPEYSPFWLVGPRPYFSLLSFDITIKYTHGHGTLLQASISGYLFVHSYLLVLVFVPQGDSTAYTGIY